MPIRDHVIVVFDPDHDSRAIRVVGPVTLVEGDALAARIAARTSLRPMWAPEDMAAPLETLGVEFR